MAVITMTTVGNDETWPMNSAVGGLPSRIRMKLTEVLEAGHGLSSAEIKEKAEDSMQADLTALIQERNGSKAKKS